MAATPLTEAFDALIRANHAFHVHWKACLSRGNCPQCTTLLDAKNNTRQKYNQMALEQMTDTMPVMAVPLAHTMPKRDANDDLVFLRKQAD